MLNTCQFSAAKNNAEVNALIQEKTFQDGERASFSTFKKEASQITDIFNETWLRTEYDTSGRQAVAAEKFRGYREDSDLYPYWRYLRTISLNPRDEHLRLVGRIFRIGDYEGDQVFPPDGFNCGCGSEQLYDLNGETLSKGSDYINDVDPQFRFNPADQGIMPKESHSYFEVLPNANAGNGELFGITGREANKSKLAAKGLHAVMEIYKGWQDKYHQDTQHNIVFQNKATYTNVKFGNTALHTIQKHSAGFEELADTVTKANEVWSYWQDPDKQLISCRNYIRGNYVVQTVSGIVTDGFLIDNVNRYRKGVIILL